MAILSAKRLPLMVTSFWISSLPFAPRSPEEIWTSCSNVISSSVKSTNWSKSEKRGEFADWLELAAARTSPLATRREATRCGLTKFIFLLYHATAFKQELMVQFLYATPP